MCGRFSSSRRPADLVAEFDLDPAGLPEPLPLDYNVAPTKQTYAVLPPRPAGAEAAGEASAGGRNRLAVMRWGLVPPWSKDPSQGARMINARVETVAGKPAFRRAFTGRRCLIPADGYYEWQPPAAPAAGGGRAKKAKARKQPYFITSVDGGLALAGLHEVWRDPSRDEGDPAAWLRTVVVLTTASRGPLAELHDRMPVVVAPRDYAAWLDPRLTAAEDVLELVADQPVDRFIAYPVSTAVNDVRNGGAALLSPPEGLDVADIPPGTLAAAPAEAAADPDTGGVDGTLF